MDKELVLKALLDIKNGSAIIVYEHGVKCYGICGYLSAAIPDFSDEMTEWLYGTFKIWPEFSGNIMFPIPSDLDPEPQSIASIARAKDRYSQGTCDPGLMWGNNPYADSRRRLLDFMITSLTDEKSV